MKILCICYENMGAYGGSNRQVIEIAKHLIKRGHQVVVCAPLIGRLPTQVDFAVSYIPVINIALLRRITYYLFAPFCLIRLFLTFKPNVVLIFEVYLELTALLVCKLFRCPFMFYTNAIAREELELAKTARIIIYGVELIQKLYIRSAQKIFTVTEAIKEFVIHKYKISRDKIVIVKNGVDIEVFRPIDKEETRRQLGFEKEVSLVGFVGCLFPWHGLEYLVESAPAVISQIPNVKFVIVGDGKQKQFLRTLLKKMGIMDFFIFTGQVPFERVPLYINSFDVCAVFFKPVRQNAGDPIKLYEYLACGRPVVASNVKGYGDFIERIGAGLSVNAENKDELACAIVDLLKDDMRRSRMGEAGRQEVAKFHTWEKRVRDIETYCLALHR